MDSRVDLEFTILVDFHLLLIFFCLLFFFCKRLLEFEMKEGRRGSIERMRRTHRGSIERMRRTHRGSIERMRRTHKGSIERMRRTHKGSIERMRRTNKGSFERMRRTNTFFSYERTRKHTHTHYRFTSKFKRFFSPIFKLLSYPPGPPSTYNISIIFQSCVLAYCPRPDYASLSKSFYKGSFKKGFTRKSDFFYPSLVFKTQFCKQYLFKL